MKLARRAALAAILAAGLAPASLPVTVQAEELAPIFYNLTTDDAWTAGMALAQANTAAGRGHPITVFLNVRAVYLADADAKQGTFGPTGKTPAELLSALIAKGHKVLVCGTCMRAGGVGKGDLIGGAEVANPDKTFGAMTVPGTITLSY